MPCGHQINLRRWFHMHPELSYEEKKTSNKVVEVLRSYGITEVFEGVGQTGVVALIRGTKSKSNQLDII